MARVHKDISEATGTVFDSETHVANARNVLRVEQLCVDYAGTRTVNDVSFCVPCGSIVGLVGESGAGKSTVLRSVVRLIPTSARIASGSILLGESNLLDLSEKELEQVRGARISTIFQNPGSYLDPSMRVGKQIIEVLQQHTGCTRAEARSHTLELFERMRLSRPEKLIRAYPFELSGGMQQRVAIALAMAFKPELLLADEPTSALDATTQLSICKELVRLKRAFGTSILLVTHNIGLAYHMCDYVHVMQQGRIVEGGVTGQVLDNPQADLTKRLIASVPGVTS